MKLTEIQGGVCAPKGFVAGGILSGIRPGRKKPDLAMILCEKECAAAAVYTQNKVKGAPLLVTRQNISDGRARAVLCNSGNANTCNPNGVEVAQACCLLAAEATGLTQNDIVVASTGVIGQELSLQPFETGIPKLVKALSADGSKHAAEAIMTTDTTRKEFAVEFEMGGKACRVGCICKGSGMINPNMATMLIFITTDVNIHPSLLHSALAEEVQTSINQICVDGDTSTNDMAVVLASGLAGNEELCEKNADYEVFCHALHDLCVKMSRALAADGEGATKLLECEVCGAPTQTIARAIAKSIISSDLFKSAMFGEDANWGRALCAIGYTPGEFDASRVSLVLKSAAGEVLVCENSAHHPFSEEQAANVLKEDTIQILVDMHDGSAVDSAWGCDLTYEYVKINGDYRT